MTNRRPAVQYPTSSVERMNQLSDRLGAFFPYGYRVPPRHPLKVSLVMGLLGLASGGLTGISALGSQAQIYTSFAPTIIAGCLFGLLVVFPLIGWMNLDRSMICLAAVYTAIIPVAYISIQLHNMFGGTLDLRYFLIVVPLALVWAVCTYWLERRFSSRWLIGLMVTQLAVVLAMRQPPFPFINVKAIPLNLPTVITILWTLSVQQWYIHLQHIVIAICLGMFIWDRSPRPKYEMPDSAAPITSPQIDFGESH